MVLLVVAALTGLCYKKLQGRREKIERISPRSDSGKVVTSESDVE